MTPPESLHPQLGRNPFQSLRFRIVAAFIASILAMFGAQAFLFVQQNHVTTSLTLMTDGYLPLTKVTAKLERDRLRIDRDIARLARDEQRPDTGQRSVAEIYTTTFRTRTACLDDSARTDSARSTTANSG